MMKFIYILLILTIHHRSTISNPISTTPTSNYIGTPCSTNISNVWLDIVVIVDVSYAMLYSDLENLGASLGSVFYSLNIGQGNGNTEKSHTSRLALITYSNNATIQFDLNSADKTTVMKFAQLHKLRTDDRNGNMQDGLRIAFEMSQEQKSFRKQVFILASSTYQDTGIYSASTIIKQIKRDEITLITIGYHPADGVGVPESFYKLSSEGFQYDPSDSTYFSNILKGLAEINCFCPVETQQFKVWNQDLNKYVLYADCYKSTSLPALPKFTKCNNTLSDGILATVTNKEKLNFIIDNVLIDDLDKKSFTVGGKKIDDRWYWNGYENTQILFGDFPEISLDNGDYGYFGKIDGSGYHFIGSGNEIKNARPYVCQHRACDADHFCHF